MKQLKEWILLNNDTGYKFKENVIKKYNLDWYDYIIDFSKKYNLSYKQSIYHIINDLTNIPICTSGIQFKFISTKLGYSEMCKEKCKSCKNIIYKKIKENNIKKWGVGNPMQLNSIKEKQSNNNIKKWGVKNPFQSKEIKERIKKTNIEKWGVDHHTKVQEIKEKKEQTNLKKYGVKHTTQSHEIKNKAIQTNLKNCGFKCNLSDPKVIDKIKNTNIEKWGVDHIMKNSEIKERVKNTNIKKWGAKTWSESDYAIEHTFKKLKEQYPEIKSYDYSTKMITVDCNSCICGKNEYQTNVRLFRQRINVNGIHPCINMVPIKTGISTYHEDLSNWIKSICNFEVQQNNRTLLNGKEIDIYIPIRNLGIEFNGVYWHSELFKERDYHQNKSKSSIEKGITLFHIWEDDWLTKPHIIKSMIINKLGLSKKIGARLCEIREVNSNEAKQFLDQNHLQGNNNSSVRIGLYFNDELVVLMTLGKLRKVVNQTNIINEWELYRFSSKCGYVIQGAFSRLLNYFINTYSPNKIHTYASLDHSGGNVYTKAGFVLNHITSPGYWWVVDGIKQNRYNFRKDILVKAGADSTKSETQIMHERGHWRIWNSGNFKFILNVNHL